MRPSFEKSKSIRIWLHIAFWGFLYGLFLQQNPRADIFEHFEWISFLVFSAVLVYLNLYFLFPRYFFEKKYFLYTFYLILILGSGALLLRLILYSNDPPSDWFGLRHFLNLSLFVFFTSSIKFSREFFRKQDQVIKAENENLKSELSLLKTQVNPHFLFNTLNNLYGLILQNQNHEAAEITLKLSDLMRYMLESSKTDKTSLNREILFIKDYLALEKIRLAQKADIRFELTTWDKDIFIAPLLFVPLVENAFKHGLQTISEGSFAWFSLAVQDNELFFEAQNSIGKNLDVQVKSGTGLDNLRKRLDLMYPGKHQLEVEKNEKIFKVTLSITT
ncbi:MAG: histidine kinase [Thermoflexibacter sp.]|jgi:hypothetical protein|nr:histidine kinase [Thermoflexibacter sp.]